MVPSTCLEWTTVSTPSTVLWRLTHFVSVPKTLPHTSPMHRRSMASPRTSSNRTCCGVRPACASSNLRICAVSEYVQLDALVVTVCMYVQPVRQTGPHPKHFTTAKVRQSLSAQQWRSSGHRSCLRTAAVRQTGPHPKQFPTAKVRQSLSAHSGVLADIEVVYGQQQ